jgi:hypothetical protein
MRFRLRTLLIATPIVTVVLAGYVFLQIVAIQIAKESAELERAKAAAKQSP